jgi:hypothetical protein
MSFMRVEIQSISSVQIFRLKRSKSNVILEVFFDTQGLVHYEFILKGCTLYKELYIEMLRRLMDAVRMKCSEKWTQNSWFFLYGNAPAHLSLVVRKHLAGHHFPGLFMFAGLKIF